MAIVQPIMKKPDLSLLNAVEPLAPRWWLLALGPGSFNQAKSSLPLAQALAAAGAAVLPFDMPLGRFPTALDAAWAELQRLAQAKPRGARLGLAGVEAGGNLAAALALRARDEGGPPLAAQLLLSPALDPWLASASARDGHLGECDCPLARGWQDYLGPCGDATHPYIAPLASSRLQGLPPALLLTSPQDPLRDDALRYAARLAEAGVPAELQELADDGDGWHSRSSYPAPKPGQPMLQLPAELWSAVSLTLRRFLAATG